MKFRQRAQNCSWLFYRTGHRYIPTLQCARNSQNNLEYQISSTRTDESSSCVCVQEYRFSPWQNVSLNMPGRKKYFSMDSVINWDQDTGIKMDIALPARRSPIGCALGSLSVSALPDLGMAVGSTLLVTPCVGGVCSFA